MPRESAQAKAERLLATGSVMVIAADAVHTVARVRGDHGIYDTEWDRNSGWRCSCVGLGTKCSHVLATKLVTTVQKAVARV